VSEAAPVREADQLEGVVVPEQNLAPLVGHLDARQRLEALVGGDRLPSAILLHGPQGIGKATLAFALARQIFIRTGDEEAARVDGQVVAGSHPNLYALRRQPKDGKGFYTVIRVDEVRDLRERLRRTRGRSGYRVAIVDAIDDCNPSAANALLVSHRPGVLLPTIRSRCLSVALRPLADADLAEVLARARPDLPRSAVDHAVALAEGRPRRGFEAMALSDEGALAALCRWLSAPAQAPSAVHLALADQIVSGAGGAEASFAHDLLTRWLADEARAAALGGPGARRRLASANELWDKAHALFAEEESLNLDARQSLVVVFDAIRHHVQQTLVS
jgi:DNA polymerase-3 subunit delta'